MKKQRNNSTKAQVTKTDLKKVEKALRTELLRLEERLDRKFVTKFDLEDAIEGLEGRVDERARKYRDDVLTKLDGFIGEIQTMREESAAGGFQISELGERVDDHEVRITALEK